MENFCDFVKVVSWKLELYIIENNDAASRKIIQVSVSSEMRLFSEALTNSKLFCECLHLLRITFHSTSNIFCRMQRNRSIWTKFGDAMIHSGIS